MMVETAIKMGTLARLMGHCAILFVTSGVNLLARNAPSTVMMAVRRPSGNSRGMPASPVNMVANNGPSNKANGTLSNRAKKPPTAPITRVRRMRSGFDVMVCRVVYSKK